MGNCSNKKAEARPAAEESGSDKRVPQSESEKQPVRVPSSSSSIQQVVDEEKSEKRIRATEYKTSSSGSSVHHVTSDVEKSKESALLKEEEDQKPSVDTKASSSPEFMKPICTPADMKASSSPEFMEPSSSLADANLLHPLDEPDTKVSSAGMINISMLSDAELKRLEYLLIKERITRSSCPALTEKPLLSNDEMRQLGRHVRRERRLRFSGTRLLEPRRPFASQEDIDVFNVNVDKPADRMIQSSSNLLWSMPSTSGTESLTGKERTTSSKDDIDLKAQLRSPFKKRDLRKARSSSSIALCVYDVRPEEIRKMAMEEIMSKINMGTPDQEPATSSEQHHSDWSSEEVFIGGEEYSVKNELKFRRLNADELDGLWVRWRDTDVKDLRFYYSEGKGGIVTVCRDILGRGRFSLVKQARYTRADSSTDKAVKVIEMIKLPEDYNFRRLRRELVIASDLKHPNVLEVHSIFFFQHKLHVLMELAPNGTLSRYIKQNGSLSEGKARDWLLQLSEGLKYCHEGSVSHGDLTCSNVLLGTGYRLKITGFHMARIYDSSMPHMLRSGGTIEYTAPEILMHQKYNPMLADLWSLGVCFFLTLHGYPPFTEYQLKLYKLKRARKGYGQDASISQLLVPQIKASLSQNVKQLLSDLLQEDPLKRLSIRRLTDHQWFRNP